MSSIKEHLIMRGTEALEELNLGEDIIDDFEDYLDGEIEAEEYLKRLPKIDINKMNRNSLEKSIQGFSSMEKYNYKDYLNKYFEMLYKMGREGINSIVTFPSYQLEEKLEKRINNGLNKEKIIGICINEIAFSEYSFNYKSLKWLHEFCKNTPELAKRVSRALEIASNEEYIYANAEKILNSIYVYNNYNIDQEICIKYIFDLELCMIASMDKLFENNITKEQIKSIKDYIVNGKNYNENEVKPLVNLIKASKYSTYLFKFMIAISCLHRDKSKVLDKLVKLFIEANYKEAVKVIIDMSGLENKKDYDLDKKLDISTKYFIAYEVNKYYYQVDNNFLKYKSKENSKAFSEAILLCNEDIRYNLVPFIHDEEEKNTYIKNIESRCKDTIKKILSEGNTDINLISQIVSFLNDEISFESIRNDLDKLKDYPIRAYANYNFINSMKFLAELECNKVYEKIIAILFTLNFGEVIGSISNVKDNKTNLECIVKNYNIAEKYNIAIIDRMKCIDLLVDSYSYTSTYKNMIDVVIKDLIKNHRTEVISNIKKMCPKGRGLYLSKIYMKQNEENAQIILDNFSDTSKVVKEQIIDIFKDSVKYLDKVILKLNAKKQSEREVAIRVLEKFIDNNKVNEEEKNIIIENLNALLQIEKSQNNKELIIKILGIKKATEEVEELSNEDFIKKILKGNKKSSLKWLDFETLPKVRFKDSNEICSVEYLQAILICYSSLTKIGRSSDGERLAEKLEKFDFENLVNNIFDIWISNNAEVKKKYILSLVSRFGGEKAIVKLNSKINDWAKNSRGALACEAVYALALNGSNSALLIADGISRKFKYNSVKTAAGQALDFAAKELGVDREELSDKIVSTLDFDKNGQRIFDYGTRKFIVNLTPSLEIEVFDENNKKLKNLPKPAKKDNEDMAKKSYDEFKVFKKQLKNTVSIQSSRLDLALSNNRRWTVDSWINLFVNNPIMHQFAIGLIWGAYEEDILKETFRYMEDGTFNTKDEDEFTLLEDEESKKKIKIGLVHPLECSSEDIEEWKNQLEDYEIIQPIEQLNRRVFLVSEEQKEMTEDETYAGKIISGLSLSSKLLKLGWYRGNIYDAGGYSEFYKFNKELNIYAEINFEGSSVGYEYDDTTMFTVKFYNVDSEDKILNYYSNKTDKYLMKLKDVPEKLYSEIMYNVDNALSSSTRTNEGWRKLR